MPKTTTVRLDLRESSDFRVVVPIRKKYVVSGTDAVYTVRAEGLTNYEDDVDLDYNGLPTGTSAVFAADPIGKDATTVLTVDTSGLSAGKYAFNITGELATPAAATVYWVSPTGAALWSSAKSDTPLAGTACCSLATANANAAPGDVIYLRGGTYDRGIAPTNSGTADSRITFQAYDSETPVITEADTIRRYAVKLQGKSYITVDGITSSESYAFFYMGYGSCYNEIKNCTFDHSHGLYSLGLITYKTTAGTAGGGSNHNWIHDCVFSRYGSIGSSMSDNGTVRISSDVSDISSNNTVEDCVFFYGGHDAFDLGGRYNVFRNNILHNDESYYEWVVLTQAANSGASSTTLVVDDASTLPVAGHSLSVGAGTNYAEIQSIDLETNTVTLVSPLTWSVDDNVRHTPTNKPASYYFGNRNIILTNYGSGVGTAEDNLLEGNRCGYAGTPPDDDGSNGIEDAGRHTIARYNYLFGNGTGGYYNKKQASYAAKSGSWARIYNNTIYYNGFGDASLGVGYKYGIVIWSYTTYDDWPEDVVIKNNIVYGNRDEYKVATSNVLPQITYENNFNTDPSFVDTDMTNKASLVLPDLTLQAGSDCINAGGPLTLANGSGTNSTTLVVDDARLFHDGTWGSSLSDIHADQIAIGTVGNNVAISSIDYATNTITLASQKSWDDNASIWLYSNSSGDRVLYGTAPDIGAYEKVE